MAVVRIALAVITWVVTGLIMLFSVLGSLPGRLFADLSYLSILYMALGAAQKMLRAEMHILKPALIWIGFSSLALLSAAIPSAIAGVAPHNRFGMVIDLAPLAMAIITLWLWGESSSALGRRWILCLMEAGFAVVWAFFVIVLKSFPQVSGLGYHIGIGGEWPLTTFMIFLWPVISGAARIWLQEEKALVASNLVACLTVLVILWEAMWQWSLMKGLE